MRGGTLVLRRNGGKADEVLVPLACSSARLARQRVWWYAGGCAHTTLPFCAGPPDHHGTPHPQPAGCTGAPRTSGHQPEGSSPSPPGDQWCASHVESVPKSGKDRDGLTASPLLFFSFLLFFVFLFSFTEGFFCVSWLGHTGHRELGASDQSSERPTDRSWIE